ncbi:hypothetical protein P7C70_g2968, partial [Phenoliferia sp. Uapishka_3]
MKGQPERLPFANQVAGHPNSILSSPLSPATLIKPSSHRERDFYTNVGPALHPDLIGIWTPAFYGTLKLEGKMSEQGQLQPVDDAGSEMLVLENLTYRFLRPNVLDIKLGTQLFDDDAPEEKKQRMRVAAEQTTSGKTGVRITGFQVWEATTDSYVNTPKSYGKSLKPSDLLEGVTRFFAPGFAEPVASAMPPPSSLPLPLIHHVLQILLCRLKEIIDLISTIECRIRGGSVLIVVEGDESALAAALEREDTAPHSKRTTKRAEEDGDLQEGESEGGSEESDTSSVSTTDEEGQAKLHTLLPVEIRLIDFAHATSAEGEGPDRGVILGLGTTTRLLQELLDHITAEIENKI